jgi:prolyl 4-hydroxylase
LRRADIRRRRSGVDPPPPACWARSDGSTPVLAVLYLQSGVSKNRGRGSRNERFDEHHDAGFFAMSEHGERTHSIVVYLEDHAEGGALFFPALGQRFRPRAGRLVAWCNFLADGVIDQRM